MDLFGALGEVVHGLLKFVPRPTVVHRTDRLVKFTWRGRIKVKNPGLRWHWPLTTDVEEVPVVRQVLDLPPQTLMTKDRKQVIAAAVVSYSVRDVEVFVGDNYDAEQAIMEVAGAALRDAIVGRDLEQIQAVRAARAQQTEADKTLTKAAKDALAPFGVEVERMRLTDFSEARVINFVGVGSSTPVLDEE